MKFRLEQEKIGLEKERLELEKYKLGVGSNQAAKETTF